MNEETKDCTRLPVVAYAGDDDAVMGVCIVFKEGSTILPGTELCRLTDAQARLAEKDARIAQLAAHARGKNKALANALKEIERLKRTIETGLDNELALVGERTELRAQLEQLQSAFPLFDETGLSETEHHCEWSVLQERKRLHAILNPAPATADSDVREVKE